MTKLRDWAVWPVRACCNSRAALSSNDSKTQYTYYSISGSHNNWLKPFPVSSRRIKEALPHEVVDKIRSSSLRSKTIAIIEPVQKNKRKDDSATAVSTATVPSRIVRHAAAGIGMGGITSRFQEAGISLSRNRFRNLTGSGVVHGPQSVPPPPPPAQSPRQAQVNLDHDYCSSNKARRNRERSGGGGTPYVVGKASPRPSGSPPGGASPGGGGNKTVIRVSSTPVNMKRLRESTSHVVAVARSNILLKLAMPMGG